MHHISFVLHQKSILVILLAYFISTWAHVDMCVLATQFVLNKRPMDLHFFQECAVQDTRTSVQET